MKPVTSSQCTRTEGLNQHCLLLSICQAPLPPGLSLSGKEKMKTPSFPKAALVEGGGWEWGLEVLTGNAKQAFT